MIRAGEVTMSFLFFDFVLCSSCLTFAVFCLHVSSFSFVAPAAPKSGSSAKCFDMYMYVFFCFVCM